MFSIEERDDKEVVNVRLETGQKASIGPNKWEISQFFLEKGQIKAKVVGSFTQYPLVLAWAITIHKSQGSEYNNVLTLLPDNSEMPILSRELLYTAVTRAKDHATVVCSKATMKAVLTRHVQRSSGIIQRIQTAFN